MGSLAGVGRVVTEMDVALGRAHPDEMGFYRVLYVDEDSGYSFGCTVSKFYARSDPNRAIRIGLKDYPQLWDKATVSEVSQCE